MHDPKFHRIEIQEYEDGIKFTNLFKIFFDPVSNFPFFDVKSNFPDQ